MKPNHAIRSFAAVALLLAAGAALAHPGHPGHGGSQATLTFLEGLLHPLTGPDHLAAMLAVGLWSALATTRRLWLAPAVFVALLLAGALAGMAGIAPPGVEPMVAASLVVLGLLVATRWQAPAGLGLALVGGFAAFHGLAHGGEFALNAANPATVLAGMVLATAALHLTGVTLGLALRRHSVWWPRLAGGAIALLGGVLMAQMV
jgi:urease accessory protein